MITVQFYSNDRYLGNVITDVSISTIKEYFKSQDFNSIDLSAKIEKLTNSKLDTSKESEITNYNVHHFSELSRGWLEVLHTVNVYKNDK